MATAEQLGAFNQLVASGDYAGAARIAQQAGYRPDVVASYINQNLAGLNLPSNANISADVVRSLYTPTPTPTPTPITPTPVSVPSAPVPGGSSPLTPATGESQIDPVIAPYLAEALGVGRSLFLTGEQPQLYPGQMYVGPSAQTESALTQMEQLAGAAQPFYQQAATGVTTGLTGLEKTAAGEFLGGSPYRDAMIEAATRPLTQQFTEQVMPGIQSQFSQAGRLGSGAQAAVTGRATEGFGRAIGDVATNIAAQDYARERAFQEAATRDVISQAGNLGNVFSSFLAPSQVLGQVGAQREAISAQPLQEAIQRFEYTQNLPQQQFANYMAAIYGSPLGAATQQQQPQVNRVGQTLGGALIGSQIGSLFGGAGGFSGGQIGAGLGAGLGLLF